MKKVSHQMINAIWHCHVLCSIECKAKVSALIKTIHSCTNEEEVLAVRPSGFENPCLCVAELDGELALFTESGQCIQLLLKFPQDKRTSV